MKLISLYTTEVFEFNIRAYDVCFAYRPDSNWVSQHNLSINVKRSNISKEGLLAIAKSINVKKANTIINEISETVKNWNTFEEQVNVNEKLKREIGKAHLIL